MIELITEENNAIEIKYICNDCKKKFLLDAMYDRKTTDGKLICESCYDDKYFTCDDCDEISHNADSHDIDDKLICDSCYGEFYFTCGICNDIMHNDNASGEISGICIKCYENNYCNCESCGRTIHSDDSHFDNNDDGPYCERCYDENNKSNFKPESTHILKYSDMSEDKSFNIFGVEIEAIFPDLYDYDITGKEELKHFSIVEDGSLSENGREFVTCPLPNTEEGKKVLKTFCDTIGNRYLKIDSSCGLHIHFFFHRNLVTKDNIKKIIIAYRNLEELFFDMNPKSRRNNNYCKSLNNFLFSEMLKQSSIEGMLELFYEMKIRSINNKRDSRNIIPFFI
jgi:hypothetical protein